MGARLVVTLDEVLALLADLDGVLVQRPGPGDGTPEIAWGDAFAHYAPDGVLPAVQPFATVVTKDYPGEEAGLDRPGAFRVNVAATPEAFARYPAVLDPAAVDVLVPHPVYASAHWLCVVDPGPRTEQDLRQLLVDAHAAARRRRERRGR